MLHKKQWYNILCDIVKWNEDRGNKRGEIDKQLEANMLREEIEEFLDTHNLVDEVDAILDLIFVAIGTLHKLGLKPEEIVDTMQAVLDANKQKSAIKNSDGKIRKPDDFIPPEEKIKQILGV